MDLVIILCAKYLIFLFGLAAFAYFLILSKKLKIKVIIFGIITTIIAFILAKIGSSLFYDARPFVSDHVTALFKYTADNGFPSDHTLLSASIAITIFAISRKWGIGFLIISIIIGTSRVLAHVHHPIDILGGIIFALIGGFFAFYVSPKILPHIYKMSYINKWLDPPMGTPTK